MGKPSLYPVKKVIGFDEELMKAVDAWRGGRSPIPNASDAIRQILAKHLRQKGYMPKAAKTKAGDSGPTA